jgi:uncharacterized protein (DUF169 family)
MDHATLSDVLTASFELDAPPVAVRRLSEPPADVAREPRAPSACTFWRRAESEVFFADAEAHYGCPIGAMVMGFELPEPVSDDLMGVVGAMQSCGYLAEGEAQRIPTFPGGHGGVLYGPLARFPVEPEVVLLWLRPAHAMLYAEAVGAVRWVGTQAGPMLGRPACAALAAAGNGDDAALSLGCTGMRTFTEISGDRLLAAVSGDRLATLGEEVTATLAANAAMQAAYDERKARALAL